MKIVLCTDTKAFGNNMIFDPAYAKQYPGAESMSEFSKLLRSNNHQIVTSDIGLSYINANRWQPGEVSVIMDADNPDGFELLRLGCKPELLLCLESPIFAWKFYDILSQLAPKFRYRMLFEGAFKFFNADNGSNIPLCFPIFHREKLPGSKPWDKRKNIVLVAGNKYWKKSSHFSLSLKPSKYTRWWRRYQTERKSPTLRNAINNELQTKRLEAIEFFAQRQTLDIFGRDWQNLTKIPPKWQGQLAGLVKDMNPQPCDDKIETISNYKFAICFENVRWPGYVTEKIIDSLVAGVIPLYLGAPDIEDFVPEQCFINVSKFDSMEELSQHIDSIDEKTAIKMIDAGRNFLNSEQGKKHSFENFAELLYSLLIKGGRISR